ncbi:MAG: ABC transporter substrate-binding protein [Gammaproteobacteria bacterium]|nr:ABC transporter substrate-binding protein [Gammaproteobacteria bacterium]
MLLRPGYILSVFVFLSLTACSDPSSTSIRFALASSPISLDPRYATDAVSSRINRLLYQRLVDFDQKFQVKPALAGWNQLSPKHYRFKLKPVRGYFKNGERLTAYDVKATYDFILENENASPHRSSLLIIDKIIVVDDQIIDFYLKRIDPLFPGYLVIGIVPKNMAADRTTLNRIPAGSGSFSFLEWPDTSRLVLQRKSDKQLVEFIYVHDATVRALKLIRGEVDLLQNDLPRELVQYLGKENNILLKNLPGNNFTYLGFNMEDRLTSQLAIRKAIAHAIDRQSLIRYLMGGKTRLANALLTPEHWAGLKNAKAYSYNPDLSRSMLESLGYTRDKPLLLEYKTSSDPFRVRIATIIQQQLNEVGIKVSLKSFDWGTFYGDIKSGRFQMYSLSWVGIKTPDIFRYVFHSESVPPQGANRGRYINKKADELIEAAETSPDMSARGQYYQDLQEQLLFDLPYIPLWYEEHFVAYRNNISGYSLASDGNYDGLKSVEKLPSP